MLDILTTQTSSQQVGKTTQKPKSEASDSIDQPFEEEYAATGNDVEGADHDRSEEAESASGEPQSDEQANAGDGDDPSPDKIVDSGTENSEASVEEQPAFGLVDGGKAATVPQSEARQPADSPATTRRANATDLTQATATDTAKLSEDANAGKTRAASTSAAEVFVTAKAAENATLPTSGNAAEKLAIAGRSDLQSANAVLAKSDKTSMTTATALTAADHVSEKAKSAKLSEELVARGVTQRSETQVQQVTPAASNAPQAASIVPMNTLARLEAIKDKTGLDSTSAINIDALSAPESRSSLSTATAPLNQLLSRADTPVAIARQMAEALQKLPDRPVEISLNPKELGRVRMNISAAEAGITVTIVTERPETLDLMRRNIDQLVREFQSIGYTDINFAFSEGETQQGFGDDSDDRGSVASTQLEIFDTEETLDSNQTKMHAQTGVDIRL